LHEFSGKGDLTQRNAEKEGKKAKKSLTTESTARQSRNQSEL
jgi:hypothetical protein